MQIFSLVTGSKITPQLRPRANSQYKIVPAHHLHKWLYFCTTDAILAQIVREASRCNFVIPEMRNSGSGSDDQYSGAFVLPPQSGMYQEPIATLDFASLYPSIIQVTLRQPDDVAPCIRNRLFSTQQKEGCRSSCQRLAGK